MLAGAGPATVLLVACWIGLIAGFLDLGLLVLNRRVISRDFYRLGGDFPGSSPWASRFCSWCPGW